MIYNIATSRLFFTSAVVLYVGMLFTQSRLASDENLANNVKSEHIRGDLNPLSMLSFLANESVQLELGLTEAQIEGLKVINEKRRLRLREITLTHDDTTLRKVKDYYEKSFVELQNDVDEILDSTQRKRFGQIVLQIEVSRLGLAGALSKGNLGMQLDLEQEQKDNLFERGKRIEAKLDEDILRLKMTARNQLLMELDFPKRQLANELLGDDFHFLEPTAREEFLKMRERLSDSGT